jgi:membrane carboxypeptidase/penicillin-binding protein PbpC
VRVLDERVAWLISDILSDDEARSTGFGRNSMLRIDRPAAVKTGTTTDFHDNWTIGYTPSLVVGVWAGNANHEAMRNITGLTGAAPIWHQFIRTVLEGTPEESFTQPPGMVKVEVCRLSGMLPTTACPYRRMEWFIEGTQPQAEDTLYRQVTIDRSTGRLADESTPPDQRITQVVLDLPPLAQPWARSHHLILLSDMLTGVVQPTQESSSTSSPLPLSLVSPADGTIYQLSAGFDAQAQSLHLAAVGEAGLKQIMIYIDGTPVASLDAPPYETWWALTPGQHEAWAEATRANGEKTVSPRVHFEVR